MFNVGLRSIEIADPLRANSFPLIMMYPTLEQEVRHQFGPFELDVAKGAGVIEGTYPLVLISHGNGGTPWVHRDLARNLARNGMIVAMPEHLGNSRLDNSLEGTKLNLETRPRQLNLSIDHVRANVEFGGLVSEIYAIGHSIGGYTILAASGAKPYAGPYETLSGEVEAVEVQAHDLISKLVLLNPATPWFQGEDSFEHISMPILMLTGDQDEITNDFHSDLVLEGIKPRTLISHEVVENAGHFSFQSPFPVVMTNPGFPPSQDPPGFDRATYQHQLANLIQEFFEFG